MFYANKVWLEQAVQLSRLNDYAVWYARYNNVPDYKYRYYMWQYTKTGKITGINGNVDINVCLVNFDKYIKR
jgi:GH25 family lysozyme M1 (1,4-beta-N-acetylmuramidase)